LKTTITADYLYAELIGTLADIQSIIGYSQECMTEAAHNRLRRILIDNRQAAYTLDYLDLVELATYADSMNVPQRGFRMASLASEEDLAIHSQFETVAANRSIVYKTFADMDSALGWLLTTTSTT